MTSRLELNLNEAKIESLNLLAILRPEWDRKLLFLYKNANRRAPRSRCKWTIESGPPKNLFCEAGFQATLRLRVVKTGEFANYELNGTVEKIFPVDGKENEWLIVVTGNLWRGRVNDSDKYTAKVSVPCYYNSHDRSGFALVTQIASYEVLCESIFDLNRD